MAVEKLKFGTSLAGLLVDGDPGTLYAGCTLTMVEPNGPVIEIPYIRGDATKQFEPVEKWFSSRTPPENMILKTADGEICLFEIQWSGHSVKVSDGLSLGKLRPTEIVLRRREAKLTDPLLVTEVRSHIDGLKEWSRFTAINHESETNEKGLVRKVVVEIESIAKVTWQQGGATMTVQTDWRTANPEGVDDGSFNIFEWVVIETKFEKPQRFFDHLVEHRKVLQLLVLVFGSPIHFRKHQVRDETFAFRLNGGKLVHYPFTELVSRRTVHEYAEKPPTKEDLQRPLFHLPQIGGEGMAQWAGEYEKWQRFILPSTAILGRRGVYIEDLIVSLSMSLEAAGNIIGHREGEDETYRGKSKTTSTYVYRCLHLLDLDWGDRVDSLIGLARATANSYNGTKHYNKGEMPDDDETFLISQVLRKVVRLLTLHIIDPSGALLKSAREDGSLWRIRDMFVVNELHITHDGKWVKEPGHEYGQLPNGVSFD